LEGRLGIDDDLFSAGKLNQYIRSQPPLVSGDGLLLGEVAVLDHARKLDDPLQLKLAPPAANTWTFQRVDETLGFATQLLAGGIERCDLLEQLRAIVQASSLGFSNFTVDLLERPRDRRQQILDGFLASVKFGGSLGPRFAQPRLSKIQERFVVAAERVGTEGAKGFAEPGFGVAVRFQTLRMDGALLLELGLEPHLPRTAHQPRRERTDDQPD